MAITLYHNDMSVCAQKVRLTLAEKGIEYESRHLNLRAGDQKNPDYLKLNPNGYVPTLVHDDFVVCESTVICEYLDDAFPAPALKPADARGRARMRGFTKFIDAAIFPGQRKRKSLDDDGTVRAVPAVVGVEVDAAATGQPYEARLARTVGPQRRVHRIWNQSRLHPVIGH